MIHVQKGHLIVFLAENEKKLAKDKNDRQGIKATFTKINK